MIFICILVFGVLFLFFNIRRIAPGNRGSIVAGVTVALLPICFIFRDHLWASVGQAFLSVWLCEALLIYLLWCIVRLVLRIARRRPLSRHILVLAARILFSLSVVGTALMCAFGVCRNADYKIHEADVVLNRTAVTADSLIPPSPLTILFFSDLHIDPLFDRTKLERMIHDADSLRPDYIVFGGDFADVHDSVLTHDGYDTLVAQLGAMARVHSFAVNGNHEGYLERNGSDLKGFLRRAGWIPLDDSTACDMRACITGRTDFQVARVRDIPRKNLSELVPVPALPNSEVRDFSLDGLGATSLPWVVVDHEPKGIEDGYSGRLPDLALSGHTHNGQFFPGTIIIDWVWRIAHGLGELDGVKWLVSSGIDSWGPPVRIGSETEMWLVKIAY